jgi:hypothetical protein
MDVGIGFRSAPKRFAGASLQPTPTSIRQKGRKEQRKKKKTTEHDADISTIQIWGGEFSTGILRNFHPALTMIESTP